MPSRELYAIQFNLRSPESLFVIIWPGENRDVCLKLINSKRTWLTARAGDAVLLRRDKSTEWDRQFIESVQLFRVNPAECNGAIVETAQGWLDGG